MKRKRYVRLVNHDSPIADYLELRDHPHKPVPGCIARTVNLDVLIDDYCGPMLRLDLNKHNRPIGIEIIYSLDDEDVQSVEK
jgi:hypothetical protein